MFPHTYPFEVPTIIHDVAIYLISNLSIVLQGKVYESPEFQNSPLDQKGIILL